MADPKKPADDTPVFDLGTAGPCPPGQVLLHGLCVDENAVVPDTVAGGGPGGSGGGSSGCRTTDGRSPLAPLAALHAGELRLAKTITDHTVLQREMAVPVWGWAEPGAEVTVEFAGQKKTVTVDDDGKWMIGLDPMPASADSPR